jgi:hypothetical protein
MPQGVCLSLDTAFAAYCQQIDPSTALGDRCDPSATRQNGTLCGANALCVGGICQQICNRGRLMGPQCDTGAPCTLYLGSLTNDYAIGLCAPSCDFTALDDGGCDSPPGKPAQKCLRGPTGDGICVALLADAGAMGSSCDPTASIDPCVAGASCFGPLSDDAGGQYRCLRMCWDGGCPSGSSCDNDTGHCLTMNGTVSQ